MGVDVQPCRDMKSPINHFTSDLNLSRRVPLGVVLPGGRFFEDASGRIRGVVLVVGGGVDLSPIAFLCQAYGTRFLHDG